jgi:hypothetical protein
MIVKKAGGKVYGAHLTADEKKAMNMEIQRQTAEYDEKHILEIDALILWNLHQVFGFGPKRLKRFYDALAPSTEALVKRYEMEDSDSIWLCTHLLKRYGIDVKEWDKERRGNERGGVLNDG